LVALAKLSKSKVDFAYNHGTMPRKTGQSSRLKPVVWRSGLKNVVAEVIFYTQHGQKGISFTLAEMSLYARCQYKPQVQANKSFVPNC